MGESLKFSENHKNKAALLPISVIPHNGRKEGGAFCRLFFSLTVLFPGGEAATDVPLCLVLLQNDLDLLI